MNQLPCDMESNAVTINYHTPLKSDSIFHNYWSVINTVWYVSHSSVWYLLKLLWWSHFPWCSRRVLYSICMFLISQVILELCRNQMCGFLLLVCICYRHSSDGGLYNSDMNIMAVVCWKCSCNFLLEWIVMYCVIVKVFLGLHFSWTF